MMFSYTSNNYYNGMHDLLQMLEHGIHHRLTAYLVGFHKPWLLAIERMYINNIIKKITLISP